MHQHQKEPPHTVALQPHCLSSSIKAQDDPAEHDMLLSRDASSECSCVGKTLGGEKVTHLAGALWAGVVRGSGVAGLVAPGAGLLYLLHHARSKRPHHHLHSAAVACLCTQSKVLSQLDSIEFHALENDH